MHQRLLIGFELTLIHFGSDILKIVTMSVYFEHHIFLFGNEGQLRPLVTRSEGCGYTSNMAVARILKGSQLES